MQVGDDPMVRAAILIQRRPSQNASTLSSWRVKGPKLKGALSMIILLTFTRRKLQSLWR